MRESLTGKHKRLQQTIDFAACATCANKRSPKLGAAARHCAQELYRDKRVLRLTAGFLYRTIRVGRTSMSGAVFTIALAGKKLRLF